MRPAGSCPGGAQTTQCTDPLLPMSLFRSASLSLGGLGVGAYFFAMLGVTFFLSLYMLDVRGVTGVQAGLMQLPLSGVSIIASPSAPCSSPGSAFRRPSARSRPRWAGTVRADPHHGGLSLHLDGDPLRVPRTVRGWR